MLFLTAEKRTTLPVAPPGQCPFKKRFFSLDAFPKTWVIGPWLLILPKLCCQNYLHQLECRSIPRDRIWWPWGIFGCLFSRPDWIPQWSLNQPARHLKASACLIEVYCIALMIPTLNVALHHSIHTVIQSNTRARSCTIQWGRGPCSECSKVTSVD